MADINDLQEAYDVLDQAMRDAANGNFQQADIIERLNRASRANLTYHEKANKAYRDFLRDKPLVKMGLDVAKFGKDLAKSGIDSGLAARENRESFEALNPVIDAASSALKAIPIVGDGLAAALGGVGKFMVSEIQKTVEAYQSFGSVGAIAADGMTGLRRTAEEAGLSFQQFANITRENAQNLAFVAGSTAEGAQALAGVTRAARPFQESLLAMGFGINEQTEVFADFLAMNRRLGRRQTQDYNQLAVGAANYAEQLDELARITGMSRDQAQSELESQMSNQRFRAALTRLGPETAKAFQNVGAAISSITQSPALKQGFQDAIGGLGTEAARQFELATGGLGQSIITDLKSGAIDQNEALARIRDAMNAQYERLGPEFFERAGGLGGVFDDFAIGLMNMRDSQQATRESLAKVDAAQLAAKGAQDENTKQVVNAQQSLQRFALEMDKFINKNVFPTATTVVEEFSGALSGLASQINKIGTRADGGPVTAGSPYLVGEEGPELFSPNSSGFITDTSSTKKYIASRQEYAKEMIKKLFSDPHVLQDGFFTALGESVSLVRGGEGGISISGAQGESVYDSQGNFIKHMMPMMAEGFRQTLHAGGGQTAGYQTGGLNMQKHFDPSGKLTSRNLDYMAGALNMRADTDYTGMAGPRTSYSGSLTADGIEKQVGYGTLDADAHKANGGFDTPAFRELFEKMSATMAGIEANTRTGADTSKQILRATTS